MTDEAPKKNGSGELPIDALLKAKANAPAPRRDTQPRGARAARTSANKAAHAAGQSNQAAARGDDDGAQAARARVSQRRATMERKLLEQFGWVGMAVTAVDDVCGPAILEGSPRLAAALARLADENPAIYKALNASLSGSAWMEVIVAAGMIGLPIAAHHGLLPLGGLMPFAIHAHDDDQAQAQRGAGA